MYDSRQTLGNFAAEKIYSAVPVLSGELRKGASPQQAEQAPEYLEQTGEGQSLMQAVTAARLPQFITEPNASLMRRW